jgi:phosphatidylethanolamine/phosphatidyl-N-methylethanolamine N-methyltransferase
MGRRDDLKAEASVIRLARTDAHEQGAATAPARSGSGDRAAFLRGFLRHPGQVGSVTPSSAWLEQRLVRCARVAEARVVVELGPGTGGTTRALLGAMRAEARLVAIELDPGFHTHLSGTIRDPRFSVHLGNAEHIAGVLAAHRLPAPDAVVSGIPFSTMPPDVADRICAAIAHVLAPAGRFVAYQVRAHVARYATPYLGVPQHQWEWFNVPPVRVFTWNRGAAPPA